MRVARAAARRPVARDRVPGARGCCSSSNPARGDAAGLRESRFDADLAAAIEARAGAARDSRARDPTSRAAPRATRAARWALADTRDGRQQLRWGYYDADAELPSCRWTARPASRTTRPLYLVCAHSRHDTCCALRGRPVAAALHEHSPGRVWECSHIGGERFAANVLMLPSGLMYGRVLPFAAAEFVAASEAGEVVGALLRGRIGLPPAAQAALAFGYEHLALRRADSLRVVDTSRVEDGRAIVHLAGPHGELEVTVRVEQVAADGLTCATDTRPATTCPTTRSASRSPEHDRIAANKGVRDTREMTRPRPLLALLSLLAVVLAITVAARPAGAATTWHNGDGITIVSRPGRRPTRWCAWSFAPDSWPSRSVSMCCSPAVMPTARAAIPCCTCSTGRAAEPTTGWPRVAPRQRRRGYPMIVVMPDAGYDDNGGSWFTNWVDQRHLTRSGELGDVPHQSTDPVDRRQPAHHRRTIRTGRRRVVARRLRVDELRGPPPRPVRLGGVVLRCAGHRVNPVAEAARNRHHRRQRPPAWTA